MAQQDMKQANQSYDSFIGLIKWGSIVTAIVTLLIILLIAS